jgi:serine/threonine-protein kinase
MGIVVAACHIQLATKVAIKLLRPDAVSNPDAVARFMREARAAVQISGEHVARVFDVGTLDDGAPYMVMELLEGQDLGQWLEQRGVLPVEQAVEFVLQACVAVVDAHALGIVHRDLKPSNLFCVRGTDGQFLVKVLDFGISKLTDPALEAADLSMTSARAIMGSPAYMSPEQMQSSRSVDASTDIWSLGVVLFELLTGALPFDGESFGEMAVMAATQPPRSVSDLRRDVPAGLEAVIRKCLQPDRGDRHRDVAALAGALLPFAPKRSRASVERIRGIVRTSGVFPDAAELTALPSTLPPPAIPGPLASTGVTVVRPSRRAALRTGLAVSLSVLAFWAAEFGWRRSPEDGIRAQAAAPTAVSVAEGTAAPSRSPGPSGQVAPSTEPREALDASPALATSSPAPPAGPSAVPVRRATPRPVVPTAKPPTPPAPPPPSAERPAVPMGYKADLPY